jgi:hypothetical protein
MEGETKARKGDRHDTIVAMLALQCSCNGITFIIQQLGRRMDYYPALCLDLRSGLQRVRDIEEMRCSLMMDCNHVYGDGAMKVNTNRKAIRMERRCIGNLG